jgi:hypothetical protein
MDNQKDHPALDNIAHTCVALRLRPGLGTGPATGDRRPGRRGDSLLHEAAGKFGRRVADH